MPGIYPEGRSCSAGEYERFIRQREEIRAAAFNPEIMQEREEFRRFWQNIQSGKGAGIFSDTDSGRTT
ncbi:MAG: hypothetical protein ACLFUS_17445 [Candidatus Sumerlaeia bacterium]